MSDLPRPRPSLLSRDNRRMLGKLTVVAGLMFGFGGIGAALLGSLADSHGILFVYNLCSYLPLLGILAIFLPRTK